MKSVLIMSVFDKVTTERARSFEAANEFDAWRIYVRFLVQQNLDPHDYELCQLAAVVDWEINTQLEVQLPHDSGAPLVFTTYQGRLNEAWIGVLGRYDEQKINAVLSQIRESVSFLSRKVNDNDSTK